jgi:hypothetical protein
MSPRVYRRTARIVIPLASLTALTLLITGIGSTITITAFAVAIIAACGLAYRHERADR